MSHLRGIKLHFMSFCLAVFVIFSTFFSIQMSVFAYSKYTSSSSFMGQTSQSGLRFYTLSRNLDNFSLDLSSVEDDKFYFVTLNTSVLFDSTQALNLRIPYVSVGDSLVWIGSNQNNISNFSDSQTKTLVFLGSKLKEGLPVVLKAYVFKDVDLDFVLNFTFDIDVISLLELGSDSLGSYNNGYDAGYSDGEEFGYSDGYSNGYSDGQSSGFESGFKSGVDSVDTDSFFMEGYDAGREVAYVEGFDEGYIRGYSEALSLNTSDSTSLKAGETQKYSFTRDYYNLGLDMDDFNTSYPSFAYLTGLDSDIENIDGFQFSDGEIDISGGYIDSDSRVHVYGYNRSPLYSVFETSADVYAYKVTFKPSKVSLTKSNVYNLRLVFGSMSQILNDNALLGASFVHGVNNGSSFWYVNDYSPEHLFISYLARFRYIYPSESAEYDLKFSFDVEVTPYSKSEFNAAASAVEKQTLEMRQQFNDLKNGYDSSAGETMNQEFASSVKEYQTTSDSLFSSAQTGLESFTFVDFSSYPLLVTSMSFVTSLMTSVFRAMGGESGPAGIVLSVLFSVIIVSMAIGLYRFYSGKKDGDD